MVFAGRVKRKILMQTRNIIIVNAALCTAGAEIAERLTDLADGIHLLTKDVFFAQPKPQANEICLFLFDQISLENQYLRKQVNNYLAQTTQINLCMIVDNIALEKESEFFTPFNDFFIWPCSFQEIRTRLLKFIKPLQSPHDTKLLEEFVHLQLTGSTPVFLKTLSLIKKMASCHASVLIQGETGTGKENAARAIHYLGDRKNNAFIPINCAAIPDELIESELFGHEKGAFTDAKSTQAGLISLAQSGTLFLDEVDSLTPKAQASLLRFLQTQEYRPLGSKVTLQADVRIVAATNANLVQLVQQKLFREDLYFRLNVLNLQMPPLRQRRDDIPLIADSLIKKFAQQYQTRIKMLHPKTISFLKEKTWPGNIRELENILLRHFLLSNTSSLIITNEHNISENLFEVQAETKEAKKVLALSFQDAKAKAINQFEENYLKELMELASGNISAAARMAGKERRALGKLLQKYHIQKISNIHTIHESN